MIGRQSTASSGANLQRFKNEAVAAASLKHPNIIGVYAVGCERGVHYYAMEYVAGKTLAEVIAELRDANPRGGEPHLDGSLRDPPFPVSERPDHVKVPAADDTDGRLQAEASTQKPTGTKEFFCTVAQWGIQAAKGLEHAHQLGSSTAT